MFENLKRKIALIVAGVCMLSVFPVTGSNRVMAEEKVENNNTIITTAVTTAVQPVEAETTTTTVSTALVSSISTSHLSASVSDTNSVVTISSVSENQGTYDNLTYAQYEDHIEIIDCNEAATEVIIPEEINGLPVTYIGDNAFYSCEELVMVKMPDTITSTGVSIFEFCFKLKDVKLSESLTIINYDMFKSCTVLEKITIPNDVKTINECAFSNCENITDVIIPENVEYIGDFAFSDCDKLENVYIKSKNVKLGDGYNDDIVFTNGVKVPTLDNPSGGYIFFGTIHGYEGSTAEQYAKSNGITFSVLDEPDVITAVTTTDTSTTATTVSTTVSETTSKKTSASETVSATVSTTISMTVSETSTFATTTVTTETVKISGDANSDNELNVRGALDGGPDSSPLGDGP